MIIVLSLLIAILVGLVLVYFFPIFLVDPLGIFYLIIIMLIVFSTFFRVFMENDNHTTKSSITSSQKKKQPKRAKKQPSGMDKTPIVFLVLFMIIVAGVGMYEFIKAFMQDLSTWLGWNLTFTWLVVIITFMIGAFLLIALFSISSKELAETKRKSQL